MKRICTICARGGSKGVPNKNIRALAGRPLIAHSVRQARATGLFEHVAVSSDSQPILDAARDAGADILVRRPDALASDTAAKIPAIRHCVAEAEREAGIRFDIVCDLDATSPLREPDDIRACVELCESDDADNVITAMPSRRSPYFNLIEVDHDGRVTLSKKLAKPVERRQDAPKTYDMNASIYVWKRDALFAHDSVFLDRTKLYVMPEERSIDIDSEIDFALVELLASRRGALS